MEGQVVPRKDTFRYLGSMLQRDGDIDEDVSHIIKAGWMKQRWICDHARRDRVRNDDIHDRLGVAPIEEKLVQRRSLEAPVRSEILSQDSNVKRGRRRSKLTWVEAIKGDLKGWNIPKELVLDRNA